MKILRVLLLFVLCCASHTQGIYAQSHVRWTAMGHDSPLSGMKYAPNGKYFVTCALEDPHVIVWDGITGKYLFHFNAPAQAISLAISPDSRIIAIGTANSVVLFDVAARTSKVIRDSATLIVEALTFSPGGDTLGWVSSDSDNYFQGGSYTVLQDLVTGLRSVIPTHTKSYNYEGSFFSRTVGKTVVFSRKLQHVAICINDSTFVYSTLQGILECAIHHAYLGMSNADRVAFFHGGDSLLTPADDLPNSVSSIAIVDVASGRIARQIPESFTTHLHQLEYLGEDTIAGVTASKIELIPISSWDTTHTLPLVPPHSIYIPYAGVGLTVALSPERNYTLETDPLWFSGILEDDPYGVPGSIIRVHDGDTSNALTINGVDHLITAAKFAPQGDRIAVGSNALSILSRDGVVTHYVGNPVGSLDYNPDGSKLAWTTYDYGTNSFGFTQIANANSYVVEHQSQGKYGYQIGDPYSQLSFSPTDSEVAIGYVIYKYDTGTVNGYHIWPNWSRSNCYSPDGKYLYYTDSAQYDILDAHSGKEIGSGRTRSPYCAALSITHDGKKLVGGFQDGMVEIFNTANNRPITRFLAHTGGVGGVKFSPDDRYIISAGADSTIKIWDTITYSLVATIRGFDVYTGVEISHDSKDILGITRNALIDYDSLPAGLSVSPTDNIAASFTLEQNYPNPVHSSSVIEYSLPERMHVSLRIFDELGRTVAELFDGNVAAGQHSLSLNNSRLNLYQGVYYYELSTPVCVKARMLQVW